MSIDLLWAWHDDQPIVHTAVDDLESFVWVLSWVLVHILKKYGCKELFIRYMEQVLSSENLLQNIVKESIVDSQWPDEAFGNLLREWLGTLRSARRNIKKLRLDFSVSPPESISRGIACDGLELYCSRIYEKVLKSGFNHREEISSWYSRWEDVIRAMAMAPQ